MGRPRLQLNETEMANYASLGCSNREIADMLGVDEGTIRHKRFSALLAKSRSERKKELRRYQWDAAKNGNTAMLIWLGKQELGQTDKQETKNESSVVIKEGGVDTSPRTD